MYNNLGNINIEEDLTRIYDPEYTAKDYILIRDNKRSLVGLISKYTYNIYLSPEGVDFVKEKYNEYYKLKKEFIDRYLKK